MAPPKVPPRDDSQEKLDALLYLAREFTADGCPLQAIKCYEAVCNKTHLRVLPVPEARARVQLAYLLLAATDNVHRAKTHLETTVSDP
jgi:MAternally-affected-uncoordination protein